MNAIFVLLKPIYLICIRVKTLMNDLNYLIWGTNSQAMKSTSKNKLRCQWNNNNKELAFGWEKGWSRFCRLPSQSCSFGILSNLISELITQCVSWTLPSTNWLGWRWYQIIQNNELLLMSRSVQTGFWQSPLINLTANFNTLISTYSQYSNTVGNWHAIDKHTLIA